jgi:hypothetical protein
MSGAGFKASIRAGVKGAVVGGVTAGIGAKINSSLAANDAVRIAAQGVSQGAIAEAQGNTFRSGFWSGIINNQIPNSRTWEARIAVDAFAGGLVAVAYGEKFSSGARTYAFMRLLTESAVYYQVSFGASATLRSGENRSPNYFKEDQSGRQFPADHDLNVIGLNDDITTVGTLKGLVTQGGAFSRAANLVPGINATAGLHDYWFNSGKLRWNLYNNIGSVPFAMAVTYAANAGNYTDSWMNTAAFHVVSRP